jgi:hypothetical protein
MSETIAKYFVASLRRVLRPIVRQSISFGVSYGAITRLLKRLYVEVADEDFALPFKRQTDSRVALLTGISRKEIAGLRARRGEAAVPADIEDSVATYAIGRWMAGPRFTASSGEPCRLLYESDDPSTPTFSELIRSLAIDIPVRAVLDELIRLGSVTLHANGEVELVREANIPSSDIEALLGVLGTDPAELYTTIAHNIDDRANPWLQRKIAYENIGSDALEALRAASRKESEAFVRRINRLLSSHDRDRRPDAPGGRRSRVSIGIYYFEDVPSEDAPTSVKRARSGGPPGRIQRSPVGTKKKGGK